MCCKSVRAHARDARRPACAAQHFLLLREQGSVRQLINPSETFGDIVIDYSYVECTSACMTALRAFADAYPGHRPREIARAMERGRRYVLKVGLLEHVTSMMG